MRRKDIHTNIMLDLECTSIIHPNPVLLEIAAVHFNLDTGAEIDSFSTLVSYQSCLDHGLVEEKSTLDWLKANIPETLEKTKSCDVSLPQALFRLNKFVRKACAWTEAASLQRIGRKLEDSQPMIWGNGSTEDNSWIGCAYVACDMERSWKFYNNRCMRTLVDQCITITGKNFRRLERFTGSRHVALDDCRHQIKYLVKARNSLLAPSEKLSLVMSNSNIAKPVEHGMSEHSKLPRERQPRIKRIGKANPIRSPIKKQANLPIPDQSFVGIEDPPTDLVLLRESFHIPEHTTDGLITPEISFSRDVEQIGIEASPAFEKMLTLPSGKRRRLSPASNQDLIARGKWLGLPLSPNVSFCANEANQNTIMAVTTKPQAIISPNTTFMDLTHDDGSDAETDKPLLKTPKQRLSAQQLTAEERILDELELQHEKILAALSPSTPPPNILEALETLEMSTLDEDDFSEKEKFLAELAQENSGFFVPSQVLRKDDNENSIFAEQEPRAATLNQALDTQTLTDFVVKQDQIIAVERSISQEDEEAFYDAEFKSRHRGHLHEPEDFSVEDIDDEEIPESFWRGRS